jgi:ubiquinone/menaquinone biosynthesis C-methylase UbiE
MKGFARWLHTSEEEVLDQVETTSEHGRRILGELDRWNEMSGWYRAHLKRIRRHWEALGKPQPFRVLDVGCGPGGLLYAMADWSKTYGIRLELTGLDRNPLYLQMAREKIGPTVKLVEGDATHTTFETGAFHLATTTLMLHHLPNETRLKLVQELGRVSQTQYIFDLERSLTGVVGWSAIATVLRFHADTRHDGVVSVRRGTTLEEFSALVAGLPVRAERAFPVGLYTAPKGDK